MNVHTLIFQENELQFQDYLAAFNIDGTLSEILEFTSYDAQPMTEHRKKLRAS